MEREASLSTKNESESSVPSLSGDSDLIWHEPSSVAQLGASLAESTLPGEARGGRSFSMLWLGLLSWGQSQRSSVCSGKGERKGGKRS